MGGVQLCRRRSAFGWEKPDRARETGKLDHGDGDGQKRGLAGNPESGSRDRDALGRLDAGGADAPLIDRDMMFMPAAGMACKRRGGPRRGTQLIMMRDFQQNAGCPIQQQHEERNQRTRARHVQRNRSHSRFFNTRGAVIVPRAERRPWPVNRGPGVCDNDRFLVLCRNPANSERPLERKTASPSLAAFPSTYGSPLNNVLKVSP